MKYQDILTMVWASWRLNKTKVRLNLAVIAIIISVVMVLVSLGFGLSRATLGRLADHGALTSVDVSSSDPNRSPLTDTVLQRLKLIKNVTTAAPSVNYAATATSGNSSVDVDVIAATSDFFSSEVPVMISGEWQFSSNTAQEAVVSKAILSSLGYKSPAEAKNQTVALSVYVPDYNLLGGDKVAVPEILFNKVTKNIKIVGITAEENFAQVYMPLGALGLKDNYYSTVRLNVEKQSDVARARLSAEELGYQVVTYGDTFSDAKTILRVTQIVLLVLGAIALLIMSIIAAETMTITLLEHRDQVAIMKRLGMDNKTVRRLYTVEALTLVTIGSAIGMVGTYAIGWGMNLITYFIFKAQGADAVMIFYLPIYFIPLVIICAMAIGLIAGIFPARRAARMKASIR